MIEMFILGFLLCVGISALLYFLVFKKKICNGDLHHCPSAGIDICVKSDTSTKDWQAMCSKLGSGGFKNNPQLGQVSQCVNNLMSSDSDCYNIGPDGGCYNPKCQQKIYSQCCDSEGGLQSCIQNNCYR